MTFKPVDYVDDTRPTREDVIEALRLVREGDDKNKWLAGDMAVAWLSQVEHGKQKDELASLAEGAGYTYSGFRERHDCSNFWPPAARQWQEGVITWSHYNRARRGTDYAGAVERMKHADANSLTVVAFDKWLGGDKLERSNLSDEMILPVWQLNDETIERLRQADPSAHILILPSWDDAYTKARVRPDKDGS